jgi:hypothetical protein
MRRLSIALLAAVLFVGFHGTQYVFAVTYAAGWNLVAGPEGSRLSGASGSIFTLQPGDTDYEVFAADSPLHGGYGYWAFFPSGGSITLTGGSNTFSVASVPGQFIMVGNPSQSVVTISGADTAYTYTPSAGYQAATTIPPGQGAWVMGSQIALAGSGPTAPVASAPAPVASAPAPAAVVPIITTAAGLKSVGLTVADLPGFTFVSEEVNSQTGFVASYQSGFANSGVSTFGILQELIADTSASAAAPGPAAILRDWSTDSSTSNYQSLGVQGVGDDDASATLVFEGNSRVYLEVFRRGNVVVSIYSLSRLGAGSLGQVVALARIVDARIAGFR